jgi:hypothetical protein
VQQAEAETKVDARAARTHKIELTMSASSYARVARNRWLVMRALKNVRVLVLAASRDFRASINMRVRMGLFAAFDQAAARGRRRFVLS